MSSHFAELECLVGLGRRAVAEDPATKEGRRQWQSPGRCGGGWVGSLQLQLQQQQQQCRFKRVKTVHSSAPSTPKLEPPEPDIHESHAAYLKRGAEEYERYKEQLRRFH